MSELSKERNKVTANAPQPRYRSLATLLPVFFVVTHVFAQSVAPPTPTVPSTKPRSFVTQHRGTFNGISVEYSARVAETILPDTSGKPAASLISISYVKSNANQPSARPVTFVFNGGPGSSSVWLHMGAFSPRRADLPSEGKLTGSPPYAIVDNQFTLLDVTDLVFIDPIGTGFSRLLSTGKPEDFYGVIENGRSMCDFLGAWLTANKRWNSQKFVYETIARLRWNNNEPPPGMRLGVYENVAPYLGTAMRQNGDMRVFVANGYYDMLTPLFSAEHTVAHAGIPLARVKFGYYHAGHMPYLGESNLNQLSSDLRAFITGKD